MDTVEAILNGETEEEINNEDCYIHYAEDSDNIPNYIETHEKRRKEARIKNLENTYKI